MVNESVTSVVVGVFSGFPFPYPPGLTCPFPQPLAVNATTNEGRYHWLPHMAFHQPSAAAAAAGYDMHRCVCVCVCVCVD